MHLKTDRLNLREILLEDVEKVHELHSLPETDKFNTMGIPSSILVSRDLVSGWVATQDELPRKKYVMNIENNTKDFIGIIGINVGRPTYKNAEIWYKLHPKHWNQGYATEVVNRILQFCFVDLKLHRLEAGCAVDNLASIRVLEKVGMTKEGHCRQLLPIRGQWVDNFEFAILDTDFNKADQIAKP